MTKNATRNNNFMQPDNKQQMYIEAFAVLETCAFAILFFAFVLCLIVYL